MILDIACRVSENLDIKEMVSVDNIVQAVSVWKKMM